MKKIVLMLYLVLFAAFANAQFTLTPKGLVDSKDTTKNYLILNFEGKDKALLYGSILSYINKTYYSPKFVTEKAENTSLKVKAVSGLIASKRLGVLNNAKMSLEYNINIDFKDGKVKFEVLDYAYNNSGTTGLRFKLVGKSSGWYWGIWDDDLTLKHEWLKLGVEKFFNDYVNDLQKAVMEQDKW